MNINKWGAVNVWSDPQPPIGAKNAIQLSSNLQHFTSTTLGNLLDKKIRIISENVTWSDTGYLWSQAHTNTANREFGLFIFNGSYQIVAAGNVINLSPVVSVNNSTIDLTVDYNTGQVILLIDDVLIFDAYRTVGTGRTEGELFRFFARNSGYNAPAGTTIGNTSVYIDDVLVRYYDFENSDHSGSTDQPILIDTVGGNDATGVNFPSFDSSVWVNLGGGGSTYEESCTYNSISALTNSNNLVMSESLTMAADSGLNKQIQLAFDASISLISSGDIVSSATIDYETAINYSSVASVNLQNTAVMMSSLAMSSSSGLIASLGNLINESLSLGQSAGLSSSAQIDISGLISFDANANIQTSGNVNFNASLAMAVSAGMAVVNQAIFEAGLDLSAISGVEMTQSGAIVNVTTPSSRTFKIEISANEFTIATRDNVFTIPKRVK